MSDILKMIRGMSNTEREPRRKEKAPTPSKKPNLDDLDDLDVEIGSLKKENPNLVEFEKINFKELNALPDKKKVMILTREYLSIVDRYENADKQIDKLTKSVSSGGISLHQKDQDITHLKELIREIGKLIPEGIELKAKLSEMEWSTKDIQDDLLEKLKEIVIRAESVNRLAEEKTKDIVEENKALKKLIVHTEDQRLAIQNKYDELVNRINGGEVFDNEASHTSDVPDVVPETPETKEAPAKENSVVQSPEVPETKKETPQPAKPIHTSEESKPVTETSSSEVSETSEEVSPFAAYDAEVDDAPIEVDTHVLLDVEKHLDLLNDSKKYVLEVMGRTGICRNKELRTFLENDVRGKELFQKGTKFQYQEMTSVVKSLKDSGYLTPTKVDLGSKGAYNFDLFELSPLGSSIFKVITKRNPHEAEFKKILAQHKSLEHGYLIKESAEILRDKGYTVYEERADLRFDLPDGKRKDFDLIAEKGDEKLYIEVERGTHTDDDFFNAMDKIYKVMTTTLNIEPAQFHFVSPNEKLLISKTKRQFFLWIKKRHGGFSEVKGKITANFTTFDKLKKTGDNIWEVKKL